MFCNIGYVYGTIHKSRAKSVNQFIFSSGIGML